MLIGPGALAAHILEQQAARTGMVDMAKCACRGVRLGCTACPPLGAPDDGKSKPAYVPPVRKPATLGGDKVGRLLATQGDRAFWKSDATGQSGWFPIEDITVTTPEETAA